MTRVWIVTAALGAGATGPWLRALIFGHSVASGRPRRRSCPRCRRPLAARLASGLPITGRCPACRLRLGPNTGVVETIAAAAVALTAWRSPTPWVFAAASWLVLLGIALSFVDIAVHRLPDRLTATAAVGIGITAFAETLHTGHLAPMLGAVFGAAFAGSFYLAVLLVRPCTVGRGDVKAATVVGLVLGWLGPRAVFAGLVSGVLIGAATGVTLLVTRRMRWGQPYAHGPAILAGALVAFCLTT